MPRKLKVYRTPIGFHDAYVAAPSQKAAMVARGSEGNLFARELAEVVTDDELTREPLANPGKIVKRLRGSAEEQMAALPPDPQRRTKRTPGKGANGAPTPTRRTTESTRQPASKVRPRPKLKPRPSRERLDAAEKRLDKLLRRQRDEDENLR